MPNHVTNLITFGSDGVSLAAFQKMAHDMKMDGEPLGSFDFNKLIPMPPSLNIEAGTQTERGLKLYQEFAQERAAITKSELSPARKEAALAKLDRAWRPRRTRWPGSWENRRTAISRNTVTPLGTNGVSRIGEPNGTPTRAIRSRPAMTQWAF